MTGPIASEIAADDQKRAFTDCTGRASRQLSKINYCSLTPRNCSAELLLSYQALPDTTSLCSTMGTPAGNYPPANTYLLYKRVGNCSLIDRMLRPSQCFRFSISRFHLRRYDYP